MGFRIEKFVTFAICLAACSPTPEQAAPERPGAVAGREGSIPVEADELRPIIVMLGDSLTAGYQLPPQDALPEAIQDRLDGQSIDATLVNAGVSGDTTRGGLERYDWSVKGANADILLIALGANDYLSGIDPATPRENLADLIERAQADGVLVGLIGISAPDDSGLDARDEAFDAIYPELAQRYGLALYPNLMAGVLGKPELVMTDGLHPTTQGVKVIADDLAIFVSGLVDRWRETSTN